MLNPWVPSVSSTEIVALTTAVLVAWNTWKQSRQGRVIAATHTLTNSAMGKQLADKVELLQAMAVFARAAADKGNPAAVAAADAIDIRTESAKKEYSDHMLKQAKVDAGA